MVVLALLSYLNEHVQLTVLGGLAVLLELKTDDDGLVSINCYTIDPRGRGEHSVSIAKLVVRGQALTEDTFCLAEPDAFPCQSQNC